MRRTKMTDGGKAREGGVLFNSLTGLKKALTRLVEISAGHCRKSKEEKNTRICSQSMFGKKSKKTAFQQTPSEGSDPPRRL